MIEDIGDVRGMLGFARIKSMDGLPLDIFLPVDMSDDLKASSEGNLMPAIKEGAEKPGELVREKENRAGLTTDEEEDLKRKLGVWDILTEEQGYYYD